MLLESIGGGLLLDEGFSITTLLGFQCEAIGRPPSRPIVYLVRITQTIAGPANNDEEQTTQVGSLSFEFSRLTMPHKKRKHGEILAGTSEVRKKTKRFQRQRTGLFSGNAGPFVRRTGTVRYDILRRINSKWYPAINQTRGMRTRSPWSACFSTHWRPRFPQLFVCVLRKTLLLSFVYCFFMT